MKRIRRAAALAAAVLFLFTGVAAEGTENAAPAAQTAQAAGSTLKKGSKGDEVTRLQERLQELGYLSDKPDGIFGNDTVAAVKAFQRRNDLTADGQAGPLTLERMYAEDAVAAPEHILTDTLDGKLPMLVNKTHKVDEYFEPADLVLLTEVLDSKLVKVKYKDTKLVREAAEALGRASVERLERAPAGRRVDAASASQSVVGNVQGARLRTDRRAYCQDEPRYRTRQ